MSGIDLGAEEKHHMKAWLLSVVSPELWLILAMACGGYANVAWYVAIPLGAIGLWIADWPRYSNLLRELSHFGVATVLLAALPAVAECTGVFLVGRAAAWIVYRYLASPP